MILPITVAIFERGANGVPSSSYVGELSNVVAYRHAISDQFGFETMQATVNMTLDEAQDWLIPERLMRSCVVTDPDGNTLWEGFLETIDVTFGQEKRSLTLQDMANKIFVKYTNTAGEALTNTYTDTESQSIYGRKDRVFSAGNTTFNGSLNKATRAGQLLRFPRARAVSPIQTGRIGRIQATLSWVGWYQTLNWVTTARTSTTSTSTTTQVGDLIQTSGAGIGVINPFLNTTREFIASSGISDVETIASETTYLQKIEALLDQGNSSNQGYEWGVYEGRGFRVQTSAENFPTIFHQQRELGSGLLLDVYGNNVPLWTGRPGIMYQSNTLADSMTTIYNPVDSVGKHYIARAVVDLKPDQWSLTFEGRSSAPVDKLIAHIR